MPNTRSKVALRPEAALRHLQAQSRYYFQLAEFARLTGRPENSPAAYLALNRLAKQGRVVAVTRRPAGYLIIPPEHENFGAPPVTWWINDCLAPIEEHYYLALLSAARHWGSSHFARQDVQVMLSRPHQPLNPGQLKVVFTTKTNIQATPIIVVKSGVAPWRVSSRAATLLDLIRHQSAIGGLEAIIRIVKDLSKSIDAQDLILSLNALDKASSAQRLGFIFERMKLRKHARQVANWLQGRPDFMTPQPLELGSTKTPSTHLDSRWRIRYTMENLALMDELK